MPGFKFIAMQWRLSIGVMTLTFQGHVTLSSLISHWVIFYLFLQTVFRYDAPFSHNTYVIDRPPTDRRTDTTQ